MDAGWFVQIWPQEYLKADKSDMRHNGKDNAQRLFREMNYLDGVC